MFDAVSGTPGVAPPTTAQPAPKTVTVGQTATFTVTVTGTGALGYQWYRGSTPITGATSASYTTAATVATDSGALFSVWVTNPGVSVVSEQVMLTDTGGTCTATPSAPGTLSATRAATTYDYVVDAVDSSGTSGPSNHPPLERRHPTSCCRQSPMP